MRSDPPPAPARPETVPGPADEFDLVVIGAGAAGLGAARAGRRAGRRVALVEAERPGGECTHFGCVPSKTLLAAASRVAASQVAASHVAGGTGEFAAAMDRVAQVVAEVSGDESPAVLAGEGIEVISGWAEFVAPDTVQVGGRRLRGRRIVIATGAAAAVPPIPGLAEAPYLDNRTIFALTERPAHLVVLGGGAIGCELAEAFAGLGCRVTVIESAPRLLAREEPEASAVARRSLQRAGVTVHTGIPATGVVTAPDGAVQVRLADGATVAGSHLLVALGRTPVTAGLNLPAAGIVLDAAGRIRTDAYLRTSAAAVYAAGDCTARLCLTHVADEQGRLAAANALTGALRGRLVPGVAGGRRAWSDALIPAVTYTHPEIARVGLTEAQAYAVYGARAQVTMVDMATVDRARCAGAPDGFVKLIAAPGKVLRGQVFLHLVGMTAVAPTGGELIAEGALAMRAGVLLGRLAQTVHAYPSWSMATRVAAAAFFGDFQGITARPAHPEPDAVQADTVDVGDSTGTDGLRPAQAATTPGHPADTPTVSSRVPPRDGAVPAGRRAGPP